MALHVDIRNCEAGEVSDATMFTLGMTCMVTGINRVTAENFEDFLARVLFFQKVIGNIATRPFTREDLTPFIGLTVNTNSETETAWLKRISKQAMEEIRREA
jgi:hypothetical protein